MNPPLSALAPLIACVFPPSAAAIPSPTASLPLLAQASPCLRDIAAAVHFITRRKVLQLAQPPTRDSAAAVHPASPYFAFDPSPLSSVDSTASPFGRSTRPPANRQTASGLECLSGQTLKTRLCATLGRTPGLQRHSRQVSICRRDRHHPSSRNTKHVPSFRIPVTSHRIDRDDSLACDAQHLVCKPSDCGRRSRTKTLQCAGKQWNSIPCSWSATLEALGRLLSNPRGRISLSPVQADCPRSTRR